MINDKLTYLSGNSQRNLKLTLSKAQYRVGTGLTENSSLERIHTTEWGQYTPAF